MSLTRIINGVEINWIRVSDFLEDMKEGDAADFSDFTNSFCEVTKGRQGEYKVEDGKRLIITNIEDTYRYVWGIIKWEQMRTWVEHEFPVGDGLSYYVKAESDRFVGDCTCKASINVNYNTVHILGEDDCPVHGFG